jgi:hypothetical protein
MRHYPTLAFNAWKRLCGSELADFKNMYFTLRPGSQFCLSNPPKGQQLLKPVQLQLTYLHSAQKATWIVFLMHEHFGLKSLPRKMQDS